MTNQEHILIAILDWGLGHASRCVPLIRAWRAAGKRVTVASAGSALAFLRASIAADQFLELPAYKVRYPTRSMVWNLAWQSPRLWRVMSAEHKQLKKHLSTVKVDRIVSDCRFGCWHPQVESVWLAHQLQIQHSQPWLAVAANRAYHTFLTSRFDQVWVPDMEGENSLGGQLSQPIRGLPHRYLGPLSRFAETPVQKKLPSTYQWLALLSGPEPQRTYLEKELMVQLQALGVPALLVRGVEGSSTPRCVACGLDVVDWLLGDDLQTAIARSANLVCRSGYSTLMDAWYWQKPLLLIPTPGQTEQEYLARYWAEKGWARWRSQAQLSTADF